MNTEIKNFTKQDIISIIFVIAAVLNIIASDKEKEYLLTKNIKDKNTAYNIYIIVIIVFILLYIYFIKINKLAYQNANINEKKTNLIRLSGSIFFLLGAICFLYYRIDNKNNLQNIVEL